MGRRKSVREIQKQLQYAQNRAAYQAPEREENSTTQRRPKTAVKYAVLSPLAPADTAYTVQASAAGITFFGGLTGLGLVVATVDPKLPKGFKPAQVKALVSDSTPTLVRATASKRPYIRYARGNRGSNVQSNYSAPVTAATPAALDTRITAIFAAVKENLGGGYGRAWFENEVYPLAISG